MLLLAVVILSCAHPLAEAGGLALVKFNGFHRSCDFKDIGYKPGGNKVTIKRVTAPTATLQKEIIDKIAGKGALSANLLMHSTNAAKAFSVFAKAGKDFTETFADIAPKFASSLGVLGASLGFVADATKPSAQQIIDSTNRALSKFADEVNLRLDEMKGYVDEKTIQIEKTNYKEDFKQMQNLWLYCVDEKSTDDNIDCQKDAAKFIISTTKFLQFEDEMNANTDLDAYNVKRLEVSLLMFRGYTALDINVLESLGGSHELYKSRSRHHEERFKYYIRRMVSDIKRFKKYANWAVEQIKRVHLQNNCDKTMTCRKEEIKEGFLIKKHTATKIMCDCSFDKTLVGSTRCQSNLFYRRDGKLLLSPWYTIYKGSNPLLYESLRLLNIKSKAYRENVEKFIDTYWRNEVIDLTSTWDDVIERAEQRLAGKNVKRSVDDNDEEDDYDDDDDIDEDYSDKFAARLKKIKSYLKNNHF